MGARRADGAPGFAEPLRAHSAPLLPRSVVVNRRRRVLRSLALDARPRGPLGRDEEEGLLDVLAEGHTLDRKFDTSEEAHILL
jgi:hypothetical protein